MSWYRCVVVWCFLITFACGSDLWSLGTEVQIAQRAERDVNFPLPINNITTYGINLNTQVFDIVGYNTAAMNSIHSLLDDGVQLLTLDLYWNEYIGKWQLCPGPIPNNQTYDLTSNISLTWNGKLMVCEPGLTIQSFTNIIYNHILHTNNIMSTDVLQVLLNLKSIAYKNVNLTVSSSIYNYPSSSPYLDLGNSSLVVSLSELTNYIFTPIDLINYSQQRRLELSENPFNATAKLPSSQTFLLTNAVRILFNVINNELNNSTKTYHITDDDTETLFFPGGNITSSVVPTSRDLYTSCVNAINGMTIDSRLRDLEKTDYQFVYDSMSIPFDNTTFKAYLRCGLSPILTSNINMMKQPRNATIFGKVDNFLSEASWMWGYDQPDLNQTAPDQDHSTATMSTNTTFVDSSSNNSSFGYNCVALYEDGFRVENCYKEFPLACLKMNTSSMWAISSGKKPYFNSIEDDACPNGYRFAVPRLAINVLELIFAMRASKVDYPVWVDLNDITVTNCFVTNGPYAQCPYKVIVSRSKMVRMIAPSFSVAAAIIILVLLEKFLRINPIQTNRKTYWKRVINEYNLKYDYEGVPS
jgi:hypothetical protein